MGIQDWWNVVSELGEGSQVGSSGHSEEKLHDENPRDYFGSLKCVWEACNLGSVFHQEATERGR